MLHGELDGRTRSVGPPLFWVSDTIKDILRRDGILDIIKISRVSY